MTSNLCTCVLTHQRFWVWDSRGLLVKWSILMGMRFIREVINAMVEILRQVQAHRAELAWVPESPLIGFRGMGGPMLPVVL